MQFLSFLRNTSSEKVKIVIKLPVKVRKVDSIAQEFATG